MEYKIFFRNPTCDHKGCFFGGMMGKNFMTPPKRGEKFHDPTKKWKKNSCPPKITRPHRLLVYDRSLNMFSVIVPMVTKHDVVLLNSPRQHGNWRIYFYESFCGENPRSDIIVVRLVFTQSSNIFRY